MFSHNDALNDLFDPFENEVGSDYTTYNLICLDLLENVKDIFDKESTNIFKTAKKYWIDRNIPEETLTEARIKAWRLERKIRNEHGSGNSSYKAIRCLICTLYAKDEDIVMSIDTFLDYYLHLYQDIEQIRRRILRHTRS